MAVDPAAWLLLPHGDTALAEYVEGQLHGHGVLDDALRRKALLAGYIQSQPLSQVRQVAIVILHERLNRPLVQHVVSRE